MLAKTDDVCSYVYELLCTVCLNCISLVSLTDWPTNNWSGVGNTFESLKYISMYVNILEIRLL